ncbi:MAG: glycogen debranching enzyme [Candidatus Nanohaloarchaea archaeon]|jgi:glycogen debranching enzyme
MHVLYPNNLLNLDMAYHLREGFSGRTGTISNLNGFLYRDLDTGFSTKWSGYWNPPYKYLDYLAVKINGVWLNKNTLEGVDYSSDKIVFYHETESLAVKEVVRTPKRFPGFKVDLEVDNKTEDSKAVLAKAELGIDIRKRNQDIGNQDYSIEKNNNRFIVSNSASKAIISSEEDFELNGDQYLKEHYPGEKQKCFIPGKIVFKEEIAGQESETFSIEVKTGEASFKEIEDPQPKVEDHDIARLFNTSVSSMRRLVYDEDGLGIIAGHPWFQNFWGRDMFWTLLGYIDAGFYESSHEMLENYAKQKGFPTRIKEDENADRQGADEAALFVIAADKLRRHWKISGDIEEKMGEGIKTIETDEKGVVNHHKDGTWMDTLEREQAVEIQSLNLKAASITDSDKEQDLEKGLTEFISSDYIKDTIKGKERTINPVIPLMFNQIKGKEAEKALEVINAEFSSLYGARTRSMSDPGYDSSGYHTGSVWGLTTGWAAAADLANGKSGQGVNFLEKLAQYLDRNQLGGLPEVVDAESGELLGCGEQAWSAGLVAHVIDSYLLGMRAENGKLIIDPSGEVTCVRRNKRVGDSTVDLKFKDGEVQILDNNGVDVEVKNQ